MGLNTSPLAEKDLSWEYVINSIQGQAAKAQTANISINAGNAEVRGMVNLNAMKRDRSLVGIRPKYMHLIIGM
jgi:hypothetical protein